MRKSSYYLAAACAFALSTFSNMYGETSPIDESQLQISETEASSQPAQPIPTAAPKPSKAPFHPFTGKIVKNKVRLRLQPSLDSPILKELGRGDLIIIVDETDDFYVVQPPKDTKAYVFRTFVLDNVVEGSKVNVRLEPDIESPVIGQLSGGEKINGRVSPINNKWLEIATPDSTRFFVAKDYVENVGDVNMAAVIEKKRHDATSLLESTVKLSHDELQKPFDQINIDAIVSNLNRVISQYTDFPDQVTKAKELLKSTQEAYLQKKIQHLEAKTKQTTQNWQEKNQQLAKEMKVQQERLKDMENKLQKKGTEKGTEIVGPVLQALQPQSQDATKVAIQNDPVTPLMAQWSGVEDELYQKWLQQNQGQSRDDFYKQASEDPVTLRGIIEPYNRLVKNKPGDYVLVNPSNRLPIAFLYSTKVNLNEKVGQEITVTGVVRENHNFAFPAYFVLSIQ